MAFVRYTTKRAARRAQRTWLLGAAQFGVLGQILMAVPNGIVGGVVSDVIATAMAYLGVEAGGAAEDPPRADFRTATRSKRRRLPTGQLGNSPLEREAGGFADAARYGAAYLAAFVRAVERSQMAEEVAALDAVAQRVEEADAYAHRAAQSLRQTAEREHPLARELSASRSLRVVALEHFSGRHEHDLRETPWKELSPKIRRILEEAHVDPQTLASGWDAGWADDPVESCVRALRIAAESSETFAFDLVEWGPTPEKPPTPSLWDA